MVGTALQYTPTQHAINVIQSMTCFYLAQWEEYRKNTTKLVVFLIEKNWNGL